jgi:hypothetical protein
MGDHRTDDSTESTSVRRVKIFGERNTGSGYLERLLTRNLEIDCLRGGLPRSLRKLFPESERARDWFFDVTRKKNLGWKHAFAPSPLDLHTAHVDPTRILFLTLTKNPYAWLISLYRRPYHAKRRYENFSHFLSAPWETVAREKAGRAFANPIELWNQKNASYLRLGEYATSLVCRYEELLEDPSHFLKTLCIDYGIEPRRTPFVNVDSATKKQDRAKTFEDYRDYYLNERWRAKLDEENTRLINQSLNRELMSRLRYEWIEPTGRTGRTGIS